MSKIIRTVWGNLDYVKNETLNKFRFPGEIIYVWGSGNNGYLRSIGYDTILVSDNSIDTRYNNMSTKYYHKLETIIKADLDFGDYILVDWDSYLERSMDDVFFESLKKKSEIQCPLYSLPANFFEEISKLPMDDDFLNFFENQHKYIQKYSWRFMNSNVIPNFSFFYSRDAKIGKDLMKIAKENSILSNVEEFALFSFVGCDLMEYIRNHEPIVAVGQRRDDLESVQKSLDGLNSMIGSIITKLNYIGHK